MVLPLTEDDYLRLLAAVCPADANPTELAVLGRYYRVGLPTARTVPVDYDDRLSSRVPATAVADVVAFTRNYCLVFGQRCHSMASVEVVREDMIRAWELATSSLEERPPHLPFHAIHPQNRSSVQVGLTIPNEVLGLAELSISARFLLAELLSRGPGPLAIQNKQLSEHLSLSIKTVDCARKQLCVAGYLTAITSPTNLTQPLYSVTWPTPSSDVPRHVAARHRDASEPPFPLDSPPHSAAQLSGGNGPNKTLSELMSRFWELDATHRFSPAQARLYFYLLHEFIQPSEQRLMRHGLAVATRLDMTEEALAAARAVLAERGLLRAGITLDEMSLA